MGARIAAVGAVVAGLGIIGPSAAVAATSTPAGTRWQLDVTPNSAGTAVLYGVDCTSADACVAVGDYTLNDGTIQRGLVETWDGTAWKVQPTPQPPGHYSVLSGVSCSSPRSCTAVGTYSNHGTYPLAESWDGTTWTIQVTATLSATAASFRTVSCPTSTACTAVGNYAPRYG